MKALAVLGLVLVGGCGGSDGPGPATANRAPDKTEVTMEVATPDAGAPPASSDAASPTTAGTGTPSASASSSGGGAATDPLDDPMIGGPQEGALEKAVAPVRPRLRACFKKAREADATLAGTATFDATIAKDGKVASARFVKRDGLSEDMVGCLLTAVKAMTFENASQKSQIVAFSFGNAKKEPPKPKEPAKDGGK